jgi:hypothetical protein
MADKLDLDGPLIDIISLCGDLIGRPINQWDAEKKARLLVLCRLLLISMGPPVEEMFRRRSS